MVIKLTFVLISLVYIFFQWMCVHKCSFFIKWHFVLALYLQWGKCVVVLQGRREHQRQIRTSGKSYSTPAFIPHTHMHKHTLVHFDICIPNETSGIGAEYLQLTDRERENRENRDRGRLVSPIGPGLPFILSFHLSPVLTGYPLFCISFWTFAEFLCIPVCTWIYERRISFLFHKELLDPCTHTASPSFSSLFHLCQCGAFPQSSPIHELRACWKRSSGIPLKI